ncbi:MAG: hypothetical protein ACXWG8_00325 [Usitatibacter sp.]
MKPAAPDAEDQNEPPETPGEKPDAEDQAEGPETDDGGDEQSNVTPEEQQQYDTVVVAALSFLYADGATKMVVQKLKDESQGPGGLAKAIGHTCAMILISVKRALAQKGKQVPPDVMFGAGKEVIAEIITIAEKAGLAKQGDEQLLKTSAFEAVKAYGDAELQSGELGPQQRQEAQQEMAQLKGGAPQSGLVNGAIQAPDQQEAK